MHACQLGTVMPVMASLAAAEVADLVVVSVRRCWRARACAHISPSRNSAAEGSSRLLLSR